MRLWTLLLLALPTMVRAYVADPDITYDVVKGHTLALDVFRPSRPMSTTRPALLFIHGGCYSVGSRKDIPEEIKKLADDDFTVFSIGYRLSTVAKYPAAVTDVQQAVRFIRKNAARFGVDRHKIIAHGESAGGHLAALLGVKLMPKRDGTFDEHSSRVNMVTDWYGRTDFTASQTTGTDCAVSFLGLSRNAANMEIFRQASVMTHVDKHSAKFFIIHGTNDLQVYPQHSTLLANKLTRAGRPVDLFFYENEGHGFNRTIGWTLTRNAILSHVGKKPSPLPAEHPYFYADFEVTLRRSIPGTFEIMLANALGPRVPIWLAAGEQDFNGQAQLKGKVGVITKSQVFNLHLGQDFGALDFRWNYRRIDRP